MTATATQPVWCEYKPRGQIKRIFEHRPKMALAEGPAGTGKTTGILVQRRLLAEKYPGSRHLLTRLTRKSMTQSILKTIRKCIIEPDNPALVGPNDDFRSVYRFANGSEWVISGLDNPEKTYSSEYDTVTVFEAIETEQDQVHALFRTLRNGKMPYNQVLMDTNPGHPSHWLNVDANLGRHERIVTRHVDNPMLHNGLDWTEQGRRYMAILQQLVGARRARLLDGRWVAAEGVVYPEFDRAIHVIDKMPAGWQTWPKYRAIDFGYNDPFVCLWAAVKDDEAYVYRQWYASRGLVEEHARTILRLSEGETYERTVADHDAEDRATLARHGVDTNPAEKTISTGIEAVKARFTRGGNGRPRLFILADSLVQQDQVLLESKRPTSLVEELDCYIWKVKDGNAKDEAVDRDNHACDALRYLIMELEPRSTFSFGVVSLVDEGVE